jgi:hypothetical protein
MRIVKCLLLGAALSTPVSALAATLPARQPGLWQSTTTVTDSKGTPLPHAAGIVTVSCVDPATDLKFFFSGTSQCTSVHVDGADPTYVITGNCKDEFGKPVKINESLTYASLQSVALTAIIASPNGPLHVTSQLAYQGDCLPGMQPGDEGDIENGAFSKADNVLQFQ